MYHGAACRIVEERTGLLLGFACFVQLGFDDCGKFFQRWLSGVTALCPHVITWRHVLDCYVLERVEFLTFQAMLTFKHLRYTCLVVSCYPWILAKYVWLTLCLASVGCKRYPIIGHRECPVSSSSGAQANGTAAVPPEATRKGFRGNDERTWSGP